MNILLSYSVGFHELVSLKLNKDLGEANWAEVQVLRPVIQLHSQEYPWAVREALSLSSQICNPVPALQEHRPCQNFKFGG